VCKRDGACGSGPILAKISGAKKAHRTTTLPSPLLRSPAATLPCCCLRATRGRGRESRRPFLSFPPPTLSLLSFSIQDRSQPSHTRRTFHCTQIRSEQERERGREHSSTTRSACFLLLPLPCRPWVSSRSPSVPRFFLSSYVLLCLLFLPADLGAVSTRVLLCSVLFL
jgi:hypothetical protein